MSEQANPESSFDALISVLEKPRIRALVHDCITQLNEIFGKLSPADPLALSSLDTAVGMPASDGRMRQRGLGAQMWMSKLRLARFFSDTILPQIGHILPVTAEELADAACNHLVACIEVVAFNTGYNRFLADLHNRVGIGSKYFQGQPFHPVGGLIWPDSPIYSSKSGLSVRLLRMDEPCGQDGEPRSSLSVRLDTVATDAALNAIVRRVVPAVECIVRLLFDELAVFSEELSDLLDEQEYVDGDLPSELVEQRATAYRLAYARVILCLKLFLDQDLARDRRGKDDPYNSLRIHNAVRLAVEAEWQADIAVELSLWISSIEALLGQNEDGIADKLARRIATLLVAAPDDRKAAVDAVKSLYNLRSRVLHGESIKSTPQNTNQARDLVVGVLTAILDWLIWAERADIGGSTKESLFSQLEDAQMAGKRVVGVPDHLVRTVIPDY